MLLWTVPVARIPSAEGVLSTSVTVKDAVKVPRAVVQAFVNVAPSVTGVGSVRLTIVVSDFRPVLSVVKLVTKSGAPLVMKSAAPKVPGGLRLGVATSSVVGTKLKVVLMGTADAAPISANDPPAASRVVRRNVMFFIGIPLQGCVQTGHPGNEAQTVARML